MSQAFIVRSKNKKKTRTVYLALQTGEEVVIIFSALRGLLMSKYFTVPSWLAVVRCASSR